jgi:hypothetical protein
MVVMAKFPFASVVVVSTTVPLRSVMTTGTSTAGTFPSGTVIGTVVVVGSVVVVVVVDVEVVVGGSVVVVVVVAGVALTGRGGSEIFPATVRRFDEIQSCAEGTPP